MKDAEKRLQRMAALEEQLADMLLPLARDGIGIVAIVAEVDRAPGTTFKSMLTINVAEHSVPKLLRLVLAQAENELQSGETIQ